MSGPGIRCGGQAARGRLAAGLLLAAALGCTAGSPAGPSLLLVTVDTLRADALGAYGARPSRTPRLDRLAAESTVFERAAAPMPQTRPAHFSMLTSRYPREHGVVNNRIALPGEERTLAEILVEQGYRTGAFVGVALLATGSGAAQGFEVHDAPRDDKQRPANEVVGAALDWLGTVEDDEPFFAWVHVFDPHQPYQRLDPTLGDVDEARLRELPSVGWDELYALAEEHDGDIPQAWFDHVRSLYAAEVAWVDRWVGELLDGVARSRGLEDVVVMLTADHGECFENGVYFEHSDCMLEGALRVPLMIRHPAVFAPGARVEAAVSPIDIAPTFLALAGIEAPEVFSGRPLQQASAEPERLVLVQHPFYQQRAVKGRLQDRKVIRSVAGAPTAPVRHDVERVGVVGTRWKYLRAGREEELYRLSPEADESRNLAADDSREAARLGSALEGLLERHPLVLIDDGQINDELRATLEALGYAR